MDRSETSGTSLLCSLGLGLTIVFAVLGTVRLWDGSGPILFPALRYSLPAGLFLSAACVWRARRLGHKISIEPFGFALSLLAVFLTDWLTRSYNLIQGPAIRGEIILGAAAGAVFIRKIGKLPAGHLLVLSLIVLTTSFLGESAGRLLFSDDHAAFIYRLSLLKTNFPAIPLYFPLWNAGIDARDFFATGSLNFFLIFWPILRFFEIADVYNFCIAFLLFAILPTSIYLSSRILSLEKRAAYLAAILGSCSSLLWFRWALKYGTVGFAVSAALLPLVLALWLKVLSRDRFLTAADALGLVVLTSLMLCWSPSALVFLPLALFFAAALPRLSRKRYVPVALALLVTINLPWLGLFATSSKVFSFVANQREIVENRGQGLSTEAESPIEPMPRLALETLRESTMSANPLLILMCVPGLFLLRRDSRIVVGLTAGWLVLLGAVVSQFKPQLELERMLVILGLVLSVPAAAAADHVLSRGKSLLEKSAAAVLCGFLAASPLSASALLHNRLYDHYFFREPIVDRVVEAVRNFSGQGRALFSGFILHELSRGHIAPLALESNLPLVAKTPFHDKWRYESIFPDEVIKGGDAAMARFLDIYNAGFVFAHEPNWGKYFTDRKDQYNLKFSDGRFSGFARIGFKSNYFLEGSGEITAQTDHSVKLKLNSNSALIKFNYYPFLKSSGCKLSGRKIEFDLTFIELKDCPIGKEIEISAVSPLARLKINLGL